MSHPTNSILYDTLLDSVPREHLEKLQAQGLSEIEILNRYKVGDLQKGTGEENPCSGCGKDHEPQDCWNIGNQPSDVQIDECPECGQSNNLHTSNCVAVN